MNTARYVRHVLHSASLYPMSTFWGVTILVIPATEREWLDHGHAAIILTILGTALVLIADRRDTVALRHEVDHVTDVVDCQREALERRVRELTDALESAGIPVPPARGEPRVR